MGLIGDIVKGVGDLIGALLGVPPHTTTTSSTPGPTSAPGKPAPTPPAPTTTDPTSPKPTTPASSPSSPAQSPAPGAPQTSSPAGGNGSPAGGSGSSAPAPTSSTVPGDGGPDGVPTSPNSPTDPDSGSSDPAAGTPADGSPASGDESTTPVRGDAASPTANLGGTNPVVLPHTGDDSDNSGSNDDSGSGVPGDTSGNRPPGTSTGGSSGGSTPNSGSGDGGSGSLSPTASASKPALSTGAIVAIAVLSLLALFALLFFCCRRALIARRRRKHRDMQTNMNEKLDLRAGSRDSGWHFRSSDPEMAQMAAAASPRTSTTSSELFYPYNSPRTDEYPVNIPLPPSSSGHGTIVMHNPFRDQDGSPSPPFDLDDPFASLDSFPSPPKSLPPSVKSRLSVATTQTMQTTHTTHTATGRAL
ncbi:hypothetical protein EXIGLDRAFT_722876 [Exidia glandulosa HHB12029]|uniref:Uncharacterized protein n=1 Tax=Exidia glandulosa HHB12029 TaxID=1314781 RepID=A0A165F2V8_EXIGL|nr:hypothetical protein EXIGLDRAFT_722876 [Exidia glandulosa HHB12029]